MISKIYVLLHSLLRHKWSASSVGLERLLDRQEVTSSNLVQITKAVQNGLLFFIDTLLRPQGVHFSPLCYRKIYSLTRHGTTGRETFNLFERTGASRYILDHYDALHTAGIEYTLSDIEGLVWFADEPSTFQLLRTSRPRSNYCGRAVHVPIIADEPSTFQLLRTSRPRSDYCMWRSRPLT